MIIYIILGVSVVLNIACIYVIWNSMQKIEILEKYASAFLTDLSNLKNKIQEANLVMREADRLGAFETDDEVGTAFKIIKDCIASLEEAEETYGEK